ncbi:MAG: non-hydrolyzing UDP-N-acetylglucosamine 2-epimerase, partial [Candidatus Thorarchaeota archaeon]
MGRKQSIHLVVGARPNFIKAAPLLSELTDTLPDINVKLVHTGQHYDYNMSQVFFRQLRLPEPDFYLGIGSGLHGEQTGKLLAALERLFLQDKPDLVFVLGDVNSTLAAALAAVKIHIPVAHVEAGLRSNNMQMPEEVNRILTDHISDILFVTEEAGIQNLSREGIHDDKVHLVGNVMIDALSNLMPAVRTSDVLEKHCLSPGEYAVVTFHRPASVDNKEDLAHIQDVLTVVVKEHKVVFPVHPRTAESIQKFRMQNSFDSLDGLIMTEPYGYIDFMKLVSESSFVMTDSGGIQSEASYMGVPCITLRESTEHQITLYSGTNTLVGNNKNRIQLAIDEACSFNRSSYTIPKLL